MTNKILVALLAAGLTLPAHAAPLVAAKVSTLGLGLDAAFPLTDSVDGRIGINSFNRNFSRDVSSSGFTTHYSGKLKLQSLEALADWHPWQGGFRLTGGLIYNNNKFDMTAQPTGGNISIGGQTYTAAQAGTVTATVDFRKMAPYFGIGWGSA